MKVLSFGVTQNALPGKRTYSPTLLAMVWDFRYLALLYFFSLHTRLVNIIVHNLSRPLMLRLVTLTNCKNNDYYLSIQKYFTKNTPF